jgi:hypothetical protein
MRNEIWKDILNYEGLYQVSNLGRVKSLKRKGRLEDKILKNRVNGRGYIYVCLCKCRTHSNLSVHGIVAVAFLNHIPNGTHKIVIDHKDNDKLNNKLNNLQLITQRENSSKDKIGYSSKNTGVCWDKANSNWRALILIKSRLISLGSFKDESMAEEYYQNAVNSLKNNLPIKRWRGSKNNKRIELLIKY